MADPVILWHNPRCSKSRQALARLSGAGVAVSVREYLKQPPTAAELDEVLRKLGAEPSAIVRTGEDAYAPYKGKTLDRAAWLEALAAHPILIERPIAVRGDKAVVGRPPEKVDELL